jgi:hypothetical protein
MNEDEDNSVTSTMGHRERHWVAVFSISGKLDLNADLQESPVE